MKITLIASFSKQKTGLSRVNEELLRRIVNYPQIEAVTIICTPNNSYLPEEILVNNKVRIHRFRPIRDPRHFLRLLNILTKNEICLILEQPFILTFVIYFFSRFIFLSKIKIVQVVHDLLPYHYSNFVPFSSRFFGKIFFRFFKYMSLRYIAISQATKNDMIKFWHIDPQRINIVYLSSFIKIQNFRENFGNKQILTVGSIDLKRNYERLLKAFKIVQDKIPEAELLIAGRIGFKGEKLQKELARIIKKNPRIKYLGHLSDKEIVKLYQTVDCLIYPSLFEGFGLPPLEAMTCGCPVITSNLSSLPEVVGRAAILIDPYNVEEMAQTMIRVLGDEVLRKELSFKGIKQAKKFSWDTSANQLMKILESL